MEALRGTSSGNDGLSIATLDDPEGTLKLWPIFMQTSVGSKYYCSTWKIVTTKRWIVVINSTKGQYSNGTTQT